MLMLSMVSKLSFIFNCNPELDNNGTQDANYRGDYCLEMFLRLQLDNRTDKERKKGPPAATSKRQVTIMGWVLLVVVEGGREGRCRCWWDEM